MIPVARVAEPGEFDVRVRQKGQAWLAERPQGRPLALWAEFTPVLAKGFQDLCGYAAMKVHSGGTVDHYISVSTRRDLAYEWSNYRFASSLLNTIKWTADDTVLDPHELADNWFEIHLPSLQLILTDEVPEAIRPKAMFTLQRLRLQDDERILRWRQAWYYLYVQGKLTLEGLRENAPLLARAVEKAKSQIFSD